MTQDPRFRWIVLGVAFLSVFAAIGLGRFGYSAILPSMQQDLGISSAAAGSLASWNQAGYTAMALIAGILASRFGPRVIVTIGLFVTALGMLLTGFAAGLTAASAARLFTGLGNAMVMGPSVALMAAWFEPRRLGMASGIVSSGSALAFVVVGPTVPRLIAAGGADGWRLVWFVFGAAAFIVGILAFAVQRNSPVRTGQGATVGLRRTDMAAILRSGRAWLLAVLYFVYGFAFLLSFTFFQKRLTTDLGYSAATAGELFLVVGVTGLGAGVIWGRVSDSLGRGRTLAIVFAAEAASALVLGLWSNTAALAGAAALFGISGLGVPGVFAAACGDHFGARLAAASLGFITVFVGLGQIVGPYVGGALADAFSSLGPSYLLAAGLFLVGAMVSLLLRDSPATRAVPAGAMRAGHGSADS